MRLEMPMAAAGRVGEKGKWWLVFAYVFVLFVVFQEFIKKSHSEQVLS